MPRPILTAPWNNVFLATYAVPPPLLEPRLPPGLTLDGRDGHAFVSLVAFEFLDTRVLGVPWPGHRNFTEAKSHCAFPPLGPATSTSSRPPLGSISTRQSLCSGLCLPVGSKWQTILSTTSPSS
jgi:hypothetical protein